jgi:hypothetical protein
LGKRHRTCSDPAFAIGAKQDAYLPGIVHNDERDLEEIASTGETPLEYMLRVMRDPEAPEARRDAMATAAAPYIHSKLAQVDVTAQHNQNIIGVRVWTEAEGLAYRAQQGHPRLITDATYDAVSSEEQDKQ